MPTRSLCFKSNSSSAIGLDPLAREMMGSLHHCERMPEIERRLPCSRHWIKRHNNACRSTLVLCESDLPSDPS